MKKLILMTLALVASLNATELYNGFNLNEKIDQVKLKDFKQVDPMKYNMDPSGIVYEKDDLVLKYTDEGLVLAFTIKKGNYFNPDQVLHLDLNKEDYRFIKGTIKTNGQEYSYIVNEDEGKTAFDQYAAKVDDFNMSKISSKVSFFTTFAVKKGEEYIGATNMVSCLKVEQKQNCSNCQELEGNNLHTTCEYVKVYHSI